MQEEWLDKKKERSTQSTEVASTFLHEFAEGHVDIQERIQGMKLNLSRLIFIIIHNNSFIESQV